MNMKANVAEAFLKVEEVMKGLCCHHDREQLLDALRDQLEVDAVDEEEEEREGVVREIKEFVRGKLPLSGEAGDEKVMLPEEGEFKESTDKNSMHLDMFLYDEDDVEELVKTGEVSLHYCKGCGGRDIGELNLHSHSLPMDAMQFLFTKVLKPSEVNEKTFFDVGSRTGVILYYAALYLGEELKEIAGIEMSKEFCNVQRDTVANFKSVLPAEIVILEGDVFDEGLAKLAESDILIFHNVFEFFLPRAAQIAAWKKVRSHIKPGAILITVPALETSLSELGLDDSWVTPVPLHYPHGAENQEVIESIHKYKVNGDK